MYTWVIYDISNPKTRRNVIKECQNIGLRRVQKSIFFGEISMVDINLLNLIFENMINLETDSVYIMPMDKSHIEESEFIGGTFKKELEIEQSGYMFV